MGFLAAVEEDDVRWWTDRRLSLSVTYGFRDYCRYTRYSLNYHVAR